MRQTARWLCAITILLFLCSPLQAQEQAVKHDSVAHWLNKHSHDVMQGTMALMLLVGDHDTIHDTGATFDGMVASLAAAEALKLLFDESRPRDRKAEDGFPSSHAATAFAFAQGLSDWRSSWTVAVYAFAAGVGWARVEEGYHTPDQVLAGAALGIWIAGASLESNGFLIHRGGDQPIRTALPNGAEARNRFGASPGVVLWRRTW